MPRSKHHRGTTMEHYAGIDVSLECASVCALEASGKIVREAKVAVSQKDGLSPFAKPIGSTAR
jgi:transposase